MPEAALLPLATRQNFHVIVGTAPATLTPFTLLLPAGRVRRPQRWGEAAAPVHRHPHGVGRWGLPGLRTRPAPGQEPGRVAASASARSRWRPAIMSWPG